MTADSSSPGADRKDPRKTGNASGACLCRRPPRTCPGQEGDRRSGASREERHVTPIVNGLGCRYGTVPPLIQDGDPQALTREVGEELDGWQAWSEPVPGGGACGRHPSAPASPTTWSPLSPARSAPPRQSCAGCSRTAPGTSSYVLRSPDGLRPSHSQRMAGPQAYQCVERRKDQHGPAKRPPLHALYWPFTGPGRRFALLCG
ncbi:hypothetical protein SGPA1_12127 [Streptomyces misionensis JCM 4497]